MLSDETLEKLTEVLIKRIEESNQLILKKIAKDIKRLNSLTPTDAIELAQMLKFGGDYNKIIKKIAEVTNLNVKDIKKIFKEVAKKNQQFAKQFYDYRGIKFIPYDENIPLKSQVEAIANITANSYQNIANTRGLGFVFKDTDGNVIFKNLTDFYREIIDEAVINIFQGKTAFSTELFNKMKKVTRNGLRYVEYESGRTRRLDSALRMNMLGALRDMSNELQKQFGKNFEADGVEISVHEIPAPDHAEVQGHQFYNEEFEKFQNDDDCYDINGVEFTKEFNGHDRRSIGQYNCYHYIFSIIVGVSKPIYNDEELKNIINRSKQKFEFDGKEYTKYEGTQLQRKIETRIREEKDLQIFYREAGEEKLAQESQRSINLLTKKYNKLSNIANLKPKNERLRVSGYHKIKA